MNITCKIKVKEIDGKLLDVSDYGKHELVISSHDNCPVYVIVKLPGGQSVTVDIKDLETAIKSIKCK